jgi:hypothetical protein
MDGGSLTLVNVVPHSMFELSGDNELTVIKQTDFEQASAPHQFYVAYALFTALSAVEQAAHHYGSCSCSLGALVKDFAFAGFLDLADFAGLTSEASMLPPSPSLPGTNDTPATATARPGSVVSD